MPCLAPVMILAKAYLQTAILKCSHDHEPPNLIPTMDGPRKHSSKLEWIDLPENEQPTISQKY